MLQHPLKCYRNSPRELQGASFAKWDVAIERPPLQGMPTAGQQQQQQQQGGAGNGTLVGADAAEQQRAAEAAAAAAAAAVKAEQEAAAAKAKAEAEAERQRQQHEAAEVAARKAEEEQAAAAAAAAVRQQQDQQQQQQQQQGQKGQAGGSADGAGAIITDAEGRQHPDIDALAQAGQGGPLDVAKEQRPLQPADGGKAGGEGAGARFASVLHQQEAGSLAPEGGRKRGSVLRLSLIQGALLLGIAGVVVWSRSRRRRSLSLPVRVHSRKLLLPVWGRSSEGEERNRHE